MKASWQSRSTAPYEAGHRGRGLAKVEARAHARPGRRSRVEWGSGRSEGLAKQPIHLAARDDAQSGQYIMLGKTFKGMTDKMLKWQTERFLGTGDAPRKGTSST